MRVGGAVAALVVVSSASLPAAALGAPTDVAEAAGIYEVTTSWDVAVDDYDGDGLSDVLIGRHQHSTARLYRNDGGSFTEVDAGTFVVRDRHDCDWGDVDQNGRDDLYCSIGAFRGNGTGPNELWMQAADGTFSNKAADYGVTDIYGRGRDVTFIDVNHDPYPDLFVGNDFPRKDDQLSPNRLFINVGGTSFVEDPRPPINVELGARCAQAVDYDRDGWEDLLVCGKLRQPLKLYRNDGGLGFVDVTQSMGIKGPAAAAQFVDVDGDGDLDLIRLGNGSLRIQRRGSDAFGAASFSMPVVAGIWFSVGDVNMDDLPDIYVVHTCNAAGENVPDQLLIADANGGYAETPIPEAETGCGDVSAPIDYDQNGTMDFVVLNGHGKKEGAQVAGPVQLISFPSDVTTG
jgi:hypothetical protein